jgi:hypothetical protein
MGRERPSEKSGIWLNVIVCGNPSIKNIILASLSLKIKVERAKSYESMFLVKLNCIPVLMVD